MNRCFWRVGPEWWQPALGVTPQGERALTVLDSGLLKIDARSWLMGVALGFPLFLGLPDRLRLAGLSEPSLSST